MKRNRSFFFPPSYTKPWGVAVSDQHIGFVANPEEAVKVGMMITDWERNVRVIAPNGARLTVQAASLLL